MIPGAALLLLSTWIRVVSAKSLVDYSTVQEVNAFLENFFAQEASITQKEWIASLPTNTERIQMKEVCYFIFLHEKPRVSDAALFLNTTA